MRHWLTLGEVSALLRDFDEWNQENPQGKIKKRHFAFMRHDFDKEGWGWHLARVLLGQVEFREGVPARYLVAQELEHHN